MAKLETKNLGVRLSPRAHATLQSIADARGTSLNQAVEDSIVALGETLRKERLRAAFGKIASAEHDVEFAEGAQSEIVFAAE